MDLLAAYASDDESDPADHNQKLVEGEGAVSDLEHPLKRRKLGKTSACQPGVSAALPSAEALLADLATEHANSAALSQLAKSTAGQSVNATNIGSMTLPPPEPPRVRTFPHVEGNFATVVYITVDEPAQAQLQALTATLLSQCVQGTASAAAAALINPSSSDDAPPRQRQCSSADTTPGPAGVQLWPTFHWGSAEPSAQQAQQLHDDNQAAPAPDQQLPLHMSISRTVPIKRIQIESLQAALTKQLKPFKSFRVTLQGLLALANDAKTRCFVGVRAAGGEKQVARLVQAVNRAFITHGLQPFYEEALPHVSLAWTPGDQVVRLQPWLDTMQHDTVALKVSQVVCQVGKVRHVVWQA